MGWYADSAAESGAVVVTMPNGDLFVNFDVEDQEEVAS
jgi:hypothetical protein